MELHRLGLRLLAAADSCFNEMKVSQRTNNVLVEGQHRDSGVGIFTHKDYTYHR
jgi:hypothetical protein